MTCKPLVRASAVAIVLILLAFLFLYAASCTEPYQLGGKIRSLRRQFIDGGPECQKAHSSISSRGPEEGTSIKQYQADLPPRMTQSFVYTSKLEPQLPATLVLGSTRQRMTEMITNICLSWPGPISAAVYLPLVVGTPNKDEEIAEAITYLTQLGERLDALESCQADLILASELLADTPLVDLLPLNSLRNIALLHSQTPLVYIGDGDFVVSSSLSQTLATAEGFHELYDLAAAGSFIVVPAFEINPIDGLEDLGLDAALQRGRERALQIAWGSKADLLAAAREDGVIGPFGFWKKYTKSHGPTNYSRWQTSSEPYEAEYSFGYEPWGLALRQKVPVFDERFRGYGMNKIVWSRAIAAAGIKFMVHPDAFMVHQPHAESCAKMVWRRGRTSSKRPAPPGASLLIDSEKPCTPQVADPSSLLRSESDRQALQIKAEIANNTYVPHIAPGHCWH